MLLQNKYILFFCCWTWRAKIGLWMYVFFVKICQRSYCICSLDLVFSWKTTFLEWVWPPTWFGTKWTSNSSRNIQICKKQSLNVQGKKKKRERQTIEVFSYISYTISSSSHISYIWDLVCFKAQYVLKSLKSGTLLPCHSLVFEAKYQ